MSRRRKRGPISFSPASGQATSAVVAQVQADIDEANEFKSLGLWSDAAECYQRAIDDAISAYGIDTSATNGVYYDPKLGGEGLTGFDRTVR
jgi:hypothetical protein